MIRKCECSASIEKAHAEDQFTCQPGKFVCVCVCVSARFESSAVHCVVRGVSFQCQGCRKPDAISKCGWLCIQPRGLNALVSAASSRVQLTLSQNRGTFDSQWMLHPQVDLP